MKTEKLIQVNIINFNINNTFIKTFQNVYIKRIEP